MKTNDDHLACPTAKRHSTINSSVLKRGKLVTKLFMLFMLGGMLSAASARADALTGLYTQVALGDPDFYGGSNAGATLATGMVQSQLGPDGLPVLSAAGISRLGTGADMNPATGELLWWSAGTDPYVSLDQIPVQINSMPLNYGFPNPWYPTGQSGDQNFYRSVHFEGAFNLATAGSISLTLQVDDDAWLFIDGTLTAEDHYGYVSNTSTPMSAGTHRIDVFYDDRFPQYDQMTLSSSVPLSPVPEPGPVTLFITGFVNLLACGWKRLKAKNQGF
ncbi:MAG TPA: hypothetical protein VG077_12365 [Verrucomicrobiae bacterium]|nr:hypothetical protein [Verrucomicrobiae bacterium]